jgi:glycosyltransferase involved in cell wall biosynthesis
MILGNRKLLRVAFIGAFPPPISGNSIHIARLYHHLKEKAHKVQVLDFYGRHTPDDPFDVIRFSGGARSKIWQVLKFLWGLPRDTIVHFHVSAFGRFRWFAPVLLLATPFHKRVITIHSGSFEAEWQNPQNPLKKLYLRLLLSRFDILIVVSQGIKDFVLSLNIQSDRVNVIPAYIKEEVQHEFLPADFETIFKGKTKIITSGYLTPLYNYEILIESIRHLDQEKFHFIFAFYGVYDKQYEKGVVDFLGMYSNVTIYRDLSPQAFLAVLDSSDIYIRTALRDGDSVAVREALALGNKVYATDCVQRPSGCVLFRNAQELIDLLQGWLVEQRAQKNKTTTIDGFQQILTIYESLNGGLNNVASF